MSAPRMAERTPLAKAELEGPSLEEEERGASDAETGGSSSSSSEEKVPRRRKWCGALAVVGGLSLAAGLGVLLSHFGYQEPTWEVRSVEITSVDMPALMVQGLVAANTSQCPPSDPCGVANARGCSVCPAPGLWNAGCVCRKEAPNGEAPPGTVIEANTTACPDIDKCGLLSAKGCSTCPDGTWINEGCTCRQPLSADDFFKVIDGIFDLLTGRPVSVLGLNLRANVEVRNPNVAGARTEDGAFKILYQGTEIGSAALPPLDVPPSSSTSVNIEISVDKVPPQIGMLMAQEILQTGRELSIDVQGSVVARVAFFSVRCTTVCHLGVDMLALPATSFTRKQCSYGIAI